MPTDAVSQARGLLEELRATVPAPVASRAASLVDLTALQFDDILPGFRMRDTRHPVQHAAGRFIPEVRLTFTPVRVSADCSCGAAPACAHALATIDAALLWLRQPATPTFEDAVTTLLSHGWERSLRALDRVASEGGAVDPTALELSFRLTLVDGHAVYVTPYVHRHGKKGLTTGARLTRRRLLLEYGARLGPADARLAALLPDGDGPASRTLLHELEGHPRLHIDDGDPAPVRIERARVGIVAEDRGGTVVVTAGLDGASMPAIMLERVRRARPDEVLHHFERGTRRLSVLEVSAEVRALLAILARHGNSFPPESHGALIERLSRLSLRVPVALPRTIMGEAIPPANLPVLRLEAQGGGVIRVELRTRPLHDAATEVPGEGVRDIHVRRGTRAFHVRRDFARERAAAEALAARLPPLRDAEPQPASWAWLFPDPQGALALLAAARALDPQPELEWLGNELRLLPGPGPGALKVTLEQRRAWFGVLGGLAVEGERVELARLLDAARRRQRYVQVSAHSFVELADVLRAHLERLADHTHASRHGLEIGPSGAEALDALARAGATVEADAAWKALSARILAAHELTPRIPAALKATLRPYQVDGFRWLSRLASWNAGGVLADDMGLGKTVQALTLLLARRRLGPALVLAPTSVAYNWVDEARRFAPALRLTMYADVADRADALARLGPNDVLVLSYGLLTRDLPRLAAIHFSTIVFDEAQTLKNALTHRFRAARALQGDFRFALSGTPLENHLGELWSLFAIVFPGLLGSWEAFRERFAARIAQRLDPHAAPALARVLAPFLLRRTKAQVEAELPPRTDVRVPVVLSAAEWTLYEDARLAALSDLETRRSKLREQERRIEVLAALTRLRLLASHPRLYDAGSRLESAKLERFMELVEELRAEGHRALVFSQFTSHLALVREILDQSGIAYEYLDGKTPRRARAERVRAFQDGDAPLFLISLKAGGFGLNLTAATSVIHLDPWWNPAVEDQASDRAHRIGQARPVTVYRLVSRGTIEEQMLSLHEHKRALVAGVLEGKDLAARLSTQELIALLSPRTSAPS